MRQSNESSVVYIRHGISFLWQLSSIAVQLSARLCAISWSGVTTLIKPGPEEAQITLAQVIEHAKNTSHKANTVRAKILPMLLQHLYPLNSYSASHGNWCTATLWNRIMTAQCEGMGEVGSARYEPALLPPCPSIRVLSYSNCQEIHSRQQTGLAV